MTSNDGDPFSTLANIRAGERKEPKPGVRKREAAKTMRVRCSVSVDVWAQANLERGSPYRLWDFPVVVGGEYLVFGVTVLLGSPAAGTGVFYEVAYDTHRITHVPSTLFEIVDDRPSRQWKVRAFADGSVLFRPELFLEEYFHDRLSDGAAEETAKFDQLRAEMESE